MTLSILRHDVVLLALVFSSIISEFSSGHWGQFGPAAEDEEIKKRSISGLNGFIFPPSDENEGMVMVMGMVMEG